MTDAAPHSKEALLEEKHIIEERLQKLTHDGETNFEDMGTDEDDNAHEVEDYEINTSIVAALQARLIEINDALAQFEN